MRLSQVTRSQTTIQVPVGDEKLELVYRPAAFTPAMEDEMTELSSGNAGRIGKRFCELLAAVIVSWDLQEDDGGPVEISADRLLQLPGQFLSDCLTAIAEDMTPGEAPRRSVAGSPRAGASATNPTGTDSSQPPATSASLPGISPVSP